MRQRGEGGGELIFQGVRGKEMQRSMGGSQPAASAAAAIAVKVEVVAGKR